MEPQREIRLSRNSGCIQRARIEAVESFVRVWLDERAQTRWGRPVDVIKLADGSILKSDDYADAIFRLSDR